MPRPLDARLVLTALFVQVYSLHLLVRSLPPMASLLQAVHAKIQLSVLGEMTFG